MRAADVVIIGGGIAGISLAGRLAGRARVIVLEREDLLSYHTTGRSAAVFLETYGNADVRAWTKAARPFFEQPPQGFSATPLLSPRPMLYFARPAEEAALAEAAAENPADIEPLPEAQAYGLVPVLHRDRFTRFAIERGAADIDVNALFEGFRRMAVRGAVEILTRQEVVALERKPPGWAVRTRDESFAAPVVVNAAGAWGGQIGRLAGLGDKGLQPLRRTAVIVAAPEGIDISPWPLALSMGEPQSYFKPDAGRILASLGEETPSEPCDAQPENEDIATIAAFLEETTTIPVHRISRSWAGLRSFTPDRTPLFAFDEAAAGFFWLIGQGGYGIQTAPTISALAAEAILARL